MSRADQSIVDRLHVLALARSILARDPSQLASIAVTNETLTREWLLDLEGLRDALNAEIEQVNGALGRLGSTRAAAKYTLAA